MLGALAAYFINADDPPRNIFCFFGVDSEKIPFLDIFDMYLIISVIFNQYLVNFWQYLVLY